MKRGAGIVRTGAVLVAGAAVCWSTACGAVVGDLGASEQAAKDLRTLDADLGGSPRRSDPSRCRTGRTAAPFADEPCGEEVGGSPADLEAALASDHWLWVSRNGAVVAGPADLGEAGSWLWVTANGSLGWSPGLGLSWFWVSDVGVVTPAPSGPGGWFRLASPAQVSATPVVGAVQVQRPDGDSGGWYWSPAFGDGAPVYGGAGAIPVAPVDPRAVDSSVSDLPKDCGSKPVKPSPFSGSPGRVDGTGQLCPSEFSWVFTRTATNGSSTTVAGLVGIENRATPTEIDVTVVGEHRTVTAIRVTTTDGVRSGSAVATSASDSVCAPAGSGVELDVTLSEGGDQGPSSITICDAALADLLLG